MYQRYSMLLSVVAMLSFVSWAYWIRKNKIGPFLHKFSKRKTELQKNTRNDDDSNVSWGMNNETQSRKIKNIYLHIHIIFIVIVDVIKYVCHVFWLKTELTWFTVNNGVATKTWEECRVQGSEGFSHKSILLSKKKKYQTYKI